MYNPPLFAETDIARMHGHIRANPFGMLVTSTDAGPNADHLPFELDAEAGPYGVLKGHVALANPVWREHRVGAGALVVFSGANAYVTPSWYPQSTRPPRWCPPGTMSPYTPPARWSSSAMRRA